MGAGGRQRATCKGYYCRRQAVQQFRQTFFSLSSKQSSRPDPPGREPMAMALLADPATQTEIAKCRSARPAAWAHSVAELGPNNVLPNQPAERGRDNRSCSSALRRALRGRAERIRKGADGQRNSNRASRRNQSRSKRYHGLITQCLELSWCVRPSLTSDSTDGERVATQIPRCRLAR